MSELSDLSDEQLIEYYNLYKNEIKKSLRFEMCKVFGWDLKFGYHLYRLLDEVEQILTLGDLDLERAREGMKAIRRGDWKENELHEYFSSKELTLEKLYRESSLQHSPDENKIKTLLLECLEMHYGSLSDCIKLTNIDINQQLDELENIILKIRKGINNV